MVTVAPWHSKSLLTEGVKDAIGKSPNLLLDLIDLTLYNIRRKL